MISDPASESSKPLFEPGTEVLINTLGSGGQSLEALTTLFFLLTQLSKCQELIRGYITLDLRGGTLTRTKWHHFISLLSMLWLCTFQMGLIIYMSLHLLTPKILSLPFDPQDNAFLSWVHSYAAFHNRSNCWVCRAPPSSSIDNQFILKEISPGISLEGMMLKLKLQYFGHLMWRVDSLEKTDAGRDWGQEEKGMTEDEMAGWHHWLDGRESEWTLGVGDGQGGLACCDSWGRKESDMTEWLNWTELNWTWWISPLKEKGFLQLCDDT